MNILKSRTSGVEEMMVTNDMGHPNYIPGTFNIYETGEHDRSISKNDSGVILVPQPTESVNDPLNYKPWRKIMNLTVLCFLTAFTAATSNDVCT